jgi:transposase
MFIKVTRTGGRSYAQLVESFRDEHGKPRQRTLATLGRIDEAGGQLDALLSGLLRAKGRPAALAGPPQVQFESALALGDVWVLHQLWHELGFDRLRGVFRRARFTTAVEQAIRVMVFNRLCDADSKLGALRWLQTVALPDVRPNEMTHQHLLRSMDALMDHQAAVDECVAQLLRPLIDEQLSVVFYDLTTIRTEGLSEPSADVRKLGMSKDGVIARQFLLGVVQTADGLPIYHEVFDGNASEGPTLKPTLQRVLQRYPHVRRLVVVADRGLLSLENLQMLGELKLPNTVSAERSLEFILAVPGRRHGDFVELLEPVQAKAEATQAELVEELRWQGHRLVVAHNPQQARELTQRRRERIAALQARAQALSSKLDAQDVGQVQRGRKLSDSGAKARFFHEVCEAHLAHIIRVDLKSDLFTYDIDAAAQARAEAMDGKLLLVSNVPDLRAQEIVARYKSLADIERGFHVLKSDIEIAPVFHRLPERIRAHASICFMALVIHRVMRQRLKLAGSALSPDAALRQLRRVQRHQVRIDGAQPIAGVSTIHQDQAQTLDALKVNKPSLDAQMSLL